MYDQSFKFYVAFSILAQAQFIFVWFALVSILILTEQPVRHDRVIR